jgi:hypothetical protein
MMTQTREGSMICMTRAIRAMTGRALAFNLSVDFMI